MKVTSEKIRKLIDKASFGNCLYRKKTYARYPKKTYLCIRSADTYKKLNAPIVNGLII